MKKQIRRGVFETNSSSTHAVSIRRNKKLHFTDIPKNSEIVLNDSCSYNTDIYDEFGKLNYVVTMLASIVYERCEDEKLKINSFEEMINLDWFKWLSDVVMEESNTKVIYKCPIWDDDENAYMPYYDTTYDDWNSIENIFIDCQSDSDILENETSFKARVREIIYDPSIVIEDKENEY